MHIISLIFRYYVGVKDKKTGKMKICDAEIFQMHPKPLGSSFLLFWQLDKKW
jgi:hypothetical protein